MSQQELLFGGSEVEASCRFLDGSCVVALLFTEPTHSASQCFTMRQDAVVTHCCCPRGLRIDEIRFPGQKLARLLASACMRARNCRMAGIASDAGISFCSSISVAMSRMLRRPSIIAMMKA